MRNVFLIIGLIVFNSFSFAQTSKIKWTSTTPNLPKGSLVSYIIGLDKDENIYGLRRHNYTKTDYDIKLFENKNSIDKYDKSGKLLFSKELVIKMKGFKKIRLDNIFMLNEKIIGFASATLKTKNETYEVVYAFNINKDGEIDINSYKEVARSKAFSSYGELFGSYDYFLHENKSMVLLSRKIPEGIYTYTDKSFFTVVDHNKDVLWKKTLKLSLGEMSIDKEGNLLYSFAEEEDKIIESTVSKYNFKTDELLNYSVKLKNEMTPISVSIEEDEYTGALIVHGFYLTELEELGCYAINMNSGLERKDVAISGALYTLKKGQYSFNAHGSYLTTLGYHAVKGNGGYLIANTSIITSDDDKKISTKNILKLDANYQFKWVTPIETGNVKVSFLSSASIKSVHNNNLNLLMNSETDFYSVTINEKGEVNTNKLLNYRGDDKERMIMETYINYEISSNSYLVLARRLLGVTANSKESKFGYITF